MFCELCRRSKGVKINSVNIQHNEALQKLAKNIRGEYKPTQETQLLEICEQCEQNVMKKFKSESIEESFKDNNTELQDVIMNTEEVKPKKPKIEKDTLADDNIQQRQESPLAEDKCSIKDNIATIKTKEISNSVSNEAELEDNTKTEWQEALHDSVEVFDIIVKEEPRLNDIDDDDDDDDDDDPDQMMTENNEDSKKNITSETKTTKLTAAERARRYREKIKLDKARNDEYKRKKKESNEKRMKRGDMPKKMLQRERAKNREYIRARKLKKPAERQTTDALSSTITQAHELPEFISNKKEELPAIPTKFDENTSENKRLKRYNKQLKNKNRELQLLVDRLKGKLKDAETKKQKYKKNYKDLKNIPKA